MIRAMRTAGPTAVVAYLVLTVGSIAGLYWLAPLEYSTGQWLGLGLLPAAPAAVPALIDSYVVLSVMTGRDRRWALPIAALSGGVGQLHAAGVLPEADKTVRAKVAALAIILAVIVTARLKPLVLDVLAELATARQATAQAALDAEQAPERAAHERAMEAQQLAHRLAQEAADADHRRAVELAQARAAEDVQRAAERAVAEAQEWAEESRRRAVEMADTLAQERAARAVEVAELRANLTAQRAAHREPSRRPTRTANPQVAPEVAEGLSQSEVTVLGYMLGRGPVQRSAIVDGTGIPLGTVKRALGTLSVKGHVVACAARGQYRSVDPDMGSGEPSATDEDEPAEAAQ